MSEPSPLLQQPPPPAVISISSSPSSPPNQPHTSSDHSVESAETTARSSSPPYFHTIQSAMERRTQNWQSNLSNMFQDIRPFVQQAHNTVNHQSAQNLLQQWMPLQTAPSPSHTPQFYPLSSSTTTTTSNPSNSRHSLHSSHRSTTSEPPSFVINFENPTRSATMIDMSRLSTGSLNTPVQPGDGRPLNLLESRRAQLLATLHQPDNNATPLTSNHPPPDDASSSREPPPPSDAPPLIAPGPTADILAQIPEVRALLQSLLRYLPYIFIVLAKTLLDHMDGILDVLALIITFSHANWLLCQEVSRQAQRSCFKLVRELVYIGLVIGVIAFMLEKRNIFFSVVFAHQFSDLLTLRNLLFSVLVTDFVLKLLTVALKIGVTLLPGSVLEYKNRGRVYLAIEAVSQMYRGLTPILPWLVYLLDTYVGYEKFLGVLFSAAYIVAKGTDLLQTGKFVKHAFVELFKKVSFGIRPTKEQLQLAGGQCPICHDGYATPVQLICGHIFCESCVGTWFDREQTCPLCRAKVADDPSWRDGATTMFVQLY